MSEEKTKKPSQRTVRPWMPPFTYVQIPAIVTLRVDLQAGIVVESLINSESLDCSTATVQLSSTLPAPKGLAKRTMDVVRGVYNWPSARFYDFFRYRDPDPYADGRPADLDSSELLSRVLGGADLSAVDLTTVPSHTLAHFWSLMLSEPMGHAAEAQTQEVRWGLGVLAPHGRHLAFKTFSEPVGALPDVGKLLELARTVSNRARSYTCTWWPDGQTDMRSELDAWVTQLRDEMLCEGCQFYDHIELMGAAPEPCSHAHHRVGGERLWERRT